MIAVDGNPVNGRQTESVISLPRGRSLPLDTAGLPLVMGILNLTPDSFSDGGSHSGTVGAIDAGLRMIDQGAAILDVGGESTRPGASPVSLQEELDRVLPVLEGLRARTNVPISVDTMKAAVARHAVEVGADIINDVTALRHDPEMVRVIASSGVAVILMHMRGEPRTMQDEIHYDDLLAEIETELSGWRSIATDAGIAPSRILLDPGLGFGKSFEHNLEILGATRRLARLGPLVIGASRKGFIGKLTGRPAGAERAAGSLAAVAAAALGGAAIVRVHDVGETSDFLAVFGAIRRPKG